MNTTIFLSLIAAGFILSASTAHGATALETCSRHILTPDERTSKADMVFEGKISGASCKCMALAASGGTYGPKAECTDVITVLNTRKGNVSATFTFQNYVMLSDDANASFSLGDCQSLVDERNKKLIGENDVYYIKQTGDHFESIPLSACQ